jgi:hypothetical protein
MFPLVFLIKETTLVEMIKYMYPAIDQTTHMVDDDDEGIKIIFNMVLITVIPTRWIDCRSRLGRE